MSKPSSSIWPNRFARICQALVAIIIISYAIFAAGTAFGASSAPVNAGVVAQILCIVLFFAAIIGALTNGRQSPPKHIKTFIMSWIVSFTFIPFGLIFLSHYGY